MQSLIKSQPTAIQYVGNSTLFYFGTPSFEISRLPGKSKFEIVHSPVAPYGWEYVEYQWFDTKNGLWILGRRELEPDEIAYFERLQPHAVAYP